MKICSTCGLEKDYNEFHKNKKSKDGHKSRCKECVKYIGKVYYESNNIKERTKKNRETDKRYLEYNRKYREENKDFVSNIKKDWSQSEMGRNSKSRYYIKNSEKIKKNTKENRSSKIEYYREKDRLRRESPEYKEKHNLYIRKHRLKKPHIYAWRYLLQNTLKRLGKKKLSKTIDMLGYSAEDLKNHIESLFKEGMCWDNYGEWHIDHIKPVSLFDELENVNVVNSLDNLQPLWASENLSKGNKYN